MLSKREQKLLADCEAALQKPKWKFIRFYAISVFCLVFVASIVSDYFFEKELFVFWRFLMKVLIISAYSLALAFFMRWDMRRRYKKLLQKDTTIKETDA
jgi:hypothetical protein